MSIGQPMWVFDSSALIGIKVQVDVADQWNTGSKLLTLVEEGRIVFPKEVRDEVASGRYPDLPGAWVAKARQVMPCKPRRDSDTIRRVLTAEPNWRNALTLGEKDFADRLGEGDTIYGHVSKLRDG